MIVRQTLQMQVFVKLLKIVPCEKSSLEKVVSTKISQLRIGYQHTHLENITVVNIHFPNI